MSSDKCTDSFVDELQWEEQDSTKCDNICELKLTSEECQGIPLVSNSRCA